MKTARFELWRPQRDDVSDLYELTRSDESRRFLGGFEPTMTDSLGRLLRNAGSWSLFGYGTFMVRAHGERRIVANCGIFHSDRGFGPELRMDGVPEAGWIVHEDWWGKGAAEEIMIAALTWFYEVHGPQRIAAMIEQGHHASEQIARKLGFKRYDSYRLPTGSRLGLWEHE